MHNGGGQGHGGVQHGGQNSGQHGNHHGQHHQHQQRQHGHLNGGIPASSPAESINWTNAMQGVRQKTWVQLWHHNKNRLLILSLIGSFFVMCLFVIEYSNSRDASRHITSEHNWNHQQPTAADSQGVPSQAAIASSPSAPAENGIPSAFGAPRSPYESTQSYSNNPSQQFSQASSGGFAATGQAAPFQSRRGPGFGAPPQTAAVLNQTTGRYRMVINR